MTPSFHAHMVNGATGDPALYVDFRFERRALLFDMGDLHPLPSRKLMRINHIFVSHGHIDHFIGFDQLLRHLIGREKTVNLYGPDGFIDRVAAKLGGYTWNLTERFRTDLQFRVTEITSETAGRIASFSFKNRFQREDRGDTSFSDGVILNEDTFRVETAVLDHGGPCLGYAVSEHAHLNVWKNRLDALGLPVGPWLDDLKQAVLNDEPDTKAIHIKGQRGQEEIDRHMALGQLKADVLRMTPGQKITYVTDVAFTESNAGKIIKLARNADTLFIESTFRRDDRALADERLHLTTAQAGWLARQASVRAVEPFHFSTRYEGAEEEVRQEVLDAFISNEPQAFCKS